MQPRALLREQMRALKTKLGDPDGNRRTRRPLAALEQSKMPTKLRRKLRDNSPPRRMHQIQRSNLTRTHVETLLSLALGKRSEDILNSNP